MKSLSLALFALLITSSAQAAISCQKGYQSAQVSNESLTWTLKGLADAEIQAAAHAACLQVAQARCELSAPIGTGDNLTYRDPLSRTKFASESQCINSLESSRYETAKQKMVKVVQKIRKARADEAHRNDPETRRQAEAWAKEERAKMMRGPKY